MGVVLKNFETPITIILLEPIILELHPPLLMDSGLKLAELSPEPDKAVNSCSHLHSCQCLVCCLDWGEELLRVITSFPRTIFFRVLHGFWAGAS